MRIADSRFCRAETNPTWQSNYPPILKDFFKFLIDKNETGN